MNINVYSRYIAYVNICNFIDKDIFIIVNNNKNIFVINTLYVLTRVIAHYIISDRYY